MSASATLVSTCIFVRSWAMVKGVGRRQAGRHGLAHVDRAAGTTTPSRRADRSVVRFVCACTSDARF